MRTTRTSLTTIAAVGISALAWGAVASGPAAGMPTADVPGTWGPVRALGTGSDPSCGGLARTTTSAGTRLHALTSTTGMVYERSGNGGATWSNRVRVSGSMVPTDLGRIAAADRHVYAVWQRRDAKNWVLFLRRNTDDGRTGAWKARTRITPATGRVGRESIAAAGSTVYVATTRMRTDKVVLVIGRKHGTSWSTRELGTGVRGAGLIAAAPVVSASGRHVVVAWVHTIAGQKIVKARVSHDAGRSWGPVVKLGAGDLPTVHALGSRLAVAAGTPSRTAWVRIRTAGSWGPARAVPVGGSLEKVVPHVVLRGTWQVGIAVSIRTGAGVEETGTLTWFESPDGGATWADSQAVSPPTSYYATPCSVLWRSTGQLYVAWDQVGGAVLRART
jgi:hypothetical protein